MSSTRELVEASWRAAKRQADSGGALVGKSPSIAGQYLSIVDGNAERALRIVPSGTVFWTRVRSHLSDIATEERMARAVGGER